MRTIRIKWVAGRRIVIVGSWIKILFRRSLVSLIGGVQAIARAIGIGRDRLPRQPLFRAFGMWKGYYVGGIHMQESTGWEMHPNGDEVLTLVSGRFEIILEREGEDEIILLEPGKSCVVPQGIWHRMTIIEPGELLFLTPGDETVHRPLAKT